MTSWQDPVALALAAALAGLSLWWRHRLIARGEASHCTQCSADSGSAKGETGISPKPPSRPQTVALGALRIGRKR